MGADSGDTPAIVASLYAGLIGYGTAAVSGLDGPFAPAGFVVAACLRSRWRWRSP